MDKGTDEVYGAESRKQRTENRELGTAAKKDGLPLSMIYRKEMKGKKVTDMLCWPGLANVSPLSPSCSTQKLTKHLSSFGVWGFHSLKVLKEQG